jgi:trehalose 6-phosphate synthase
MTKLIVVSNREPYYIKRGPQGNVITQPNSGGLTSALDSIVQSAGGVWISWSGFERELPKEGEPLPERVEVGQGTAHYTLRRIPLTEREASLYYYGFANRTLWPLCHLFLGRADYDAEAWRAYKRVNQRFADAVLDEAGEQARVWVHDYHLALVPAMLRAARPQLQLGLSWHVPWPPADALRALPWARELCEGMLAANAIGFQLERYGRHFAETVHDVLGLDVTAGVGGRYDGSHIAHDGQACELVVRPMGPDFGEWATRARAARGGRAVRLRRNLTADRLVLAVDRVDFTKGILERLDAVGHFFDRYPSYRGKVVFCQIAVPSRTRGADYREMKKAIDDKVAAINQRFQSGPWQPVRYVYRSLEPGELAVYYVASDVAMVTPLRDAVATPALEYVASRMNEDGVLVLSELAGIADLLPEAVRVNPNSPDDLATALRNALELSPEDARARMRGLRERVRAIDVGHWRREFAVRAFGDELEPQVVSQPEVEAVAAAGVGDAAQHREVSM